MGVEGNKTPGDIAGEAAKAEAEVKRPAIAEERFARLMADWKRFLKPRDLLVIHEFLVRNPGERIEVTDNMDSTCKGVVEVYGNSAGIRQGLGICVLSGRNAFRFILTKKSAGKMSEYEMKRDLESVKAGTRRHCRNVCRRR